MLPGRPVNPWIIRLLVSGAKPMVPLGDPTLLGLNVVQGWGCYLRGKAVVLTWTLGHNSCHVSYQGVYLSKSHRSLSSLYEGQHSRQAASWTGICVIQSFSTWGSVCVCRCIFLCVYIHKPCPASGPLKAEPETKACTQMVCLKSDSSWHTDGGKVETVTDFIFLGSKITVDGAAAMKLKDSCFLEGKLENLDSMLKSRDTLCQQMSV